MYKIRFFEDKNGNKPVLKYLKDLRKKQDKDSRIKAAKINDYLEILCEYGTAAGEPFVKKLTGEIWELRPLRDRILFAAWIDNSFILLSHFMKKTQKTPKSEIEKAQRLLSEYKERSMKENGK